MHDPHPTRNPLAPLYLVNIGANAAGVVMVGLITFYTPLELFRFHRAFFIGGSPHIAIFYALLFLVGAAIQQRMQRPISNVLKRAAGGEPPAVSAITPARRRLLNLPFILSGANLVIWLVGSILIGATFHVVLASPVLMSFFIVFRGLMIGLIVAGLSFFLVEGASRRWVIPLLFPEGRLSQVPGVAQISVVRRIRYLMGAGTLNPLLILVGTLLFVLWEVQEVQPSAAGILRQFLAFCLILCVVYFVVVLGLNVWVGRSILQPIEAMMRLVEAIRRDDFDHAIQVVGNDELGILADGMNEMSRGLGERQRLQHYLNLAKEVQQALLPVADPEVRGLDVAGVSRYCDETGGDYFDYLETAGKDAGQLTLAVGDVAGHGLPSALLMASGRAYLRQRAALAGSLAEVLGDVNRQICHDVADSGLFMTLFLMRIDRLRRTLEWVRAGHDPAMLFDPGTGRYSELRGPGPALGLRPGWVFAEERRGGLVAGQILVVGTDGIWEARDGAGRMFGKQALCDVLRKHAVTPARHIVNRVLDALDAFRGGVGADDDATLIVIKILGMEGNGEERTPETPPREGVSS